MHHLITSSVLQRDFDLSVNVLLRVSVRMRIRASFKLCGNLSAHMEDGWGHFFFQFFFCLKSAVMKIVVNDALLCWLIV